MSETSALMPLPLFHGTTSWFLPGILKFGLGGVDIHARLRSRDFYREVWALRLQLADNDEREKLARLYGIQSTSIIANAVTPGGHNYRYDAVYCTGCERKAVTYAGRGFGSELIRVGTGWLDEIQAIDPALAETVLSSYPEIAECMADQHHPIVIRLDRVDRRFVRLDNGRPCPPELDGIAEALSFELITGANLSAITIFRAENIETSFIGAESYDLVPLTAN